MDAKKVPQAGCPMGKAALLLRFLSFLGCLFYVGSTISGIGSCFFPAQKAADRIIFLDKHLSFLRVAFFLAAVVPPLFF